MKIFSLLAPAALTAALAPEDYLKWTADTHIQEGVKKDYHYTTSVLYTGYEFAIDLTGNETLVDWYRSQIDGAVVLDDGTISDWNYTFYSLDDYRMANNFLWWYDRTGEEKYKSAAEIVRRQLDRHPRNDEGGFNHRYPIYAHQMWLDGIFMADSFYARWTAKFDCENQTAWDDIVNQFDLIERHTRNHTSGLLVHGYDESKSKVWADPVTGAAPNVWSRAVGWYFIALLEVIPLFPASHPGKARLTEYFTTLAAAIKAHQDVESNGWWLIMNDPYPGAEGNYIESSASAMFTYGLLKGIEDGYLSKDEYYPAAVKGYELLTDRFVVENQNGTLRWEGTVSVGSLSGNGTYEYYIGVPLAVDDYKGVGPFMYASQPSLWL
ncbi:glycoside hydrolase family 105 protein [Cercospora zeae-maydis SCOH1-5]|uniref:Glycoside hydrolase family 105 protein n=1 Tax=Cercospora zeae-maydis SCOH1-5 TaxID=717836 RepID=A0A6A6F6A7_9PEZI|nr:glycoside hydrolase family 105 protein [Cercospora zeae-maydis SCOH1-5]